jgi:peptide/nickel transport system ATP-binding protein
VTPDDLGSNGPDSGDTGESLPDGGVTGATSVTSRSSVSEPIATDPLLSVRGLNVHFEGFGGTARVLDGVDLSVGKGEVVTVAGETGCGKSVTMKTILGILPQPPGKIPEGEIVFDGTNLLELPESKLDELKGRRIAMISQDPMSSLNPVYTVGEQLTDTAQFGGGKGSGVINYLRRRYASEREEARERVKEMLREVRLPDAEEIMKSYPEQLSGGMRQRVLIAQALLNEPDLLIADEIGTALDVTIHDQIQSLLQDLISERDLSVLMITHNLGAAREISDRIYVMYAGRIVETAPTERLFDAPQHPYTQGLLTSVPRLTGEDMAEGIPGFIPEYEDPPTGCRFHPRCPYAHDRCREESPQRYRSDDTGVECFLYDQDHQAPEGPPDVDETVERMAGSAGENPGSPEPATRSGEAEPPPQQGDRE